MLYPKLHSIQYTGGGVKSSTAKRLTALAVFIHGCSWFQEEELNV